MATNRQPEDKSCLLNLRVQPGASRSEISGFVQGVLRVKVTAAPEKGKANAELLRFLSEVLGVSKSYLTLIKGKSSRSKLVAVDGLSEQDITARLSSYCDATPRKRPDQL